MCLFIIIIFKDFSLLVLECKDMQTYSNTVKRLQQSFLWEQQVRHLASTQTTQSHHNHTQQRLLNAETPSFTELMILFPGRNVRCSTILPVFRLLPFRASILKCDLQYTVSMLENVGRLKPTIQRNLSQQRNLQEMTGEFRM